MNDQTFMILIVGLSSVTILLCMYVKYVVHFILSPLLIMRFQCFRPKYKSIYVFFIILHSFELKCEDNNILKGLLETKEESNIDIFAFLV